MKKTIYTFIETQDENTIKNLEHFDKHGKKNVSGHVSITFGKDINGRKLVIKSDYNDEIFFFALRIETIHHLAKALNDLFETQMPAYCYATSADAEMFLDDSPENIAYKYFKEEGLKHGDIVTIYRAESYIPDNIDEIDFMKSEGYPYLVRNIKSYQIYEYDEINNRAIKSGGK